MDVLFLPQTGRVLYSEMKETAGERLNLRGLQKNQRPSSGTGNEKDRQNFTAFAALKTTDFLSFGFRQVGLFTGLLMGERDKK